jgi:LPS-assembly lipoprotein
VTRRSFLTLACGVMVLSACGFQLRGQQDYPFKRLAVAGAPAPFLGRLTRMVQGGSDTVIVKSASNADAVLHVSEVRGNSVLTMNSLGVVEEYEVTYTLLYSLNGTDGTVLLPQSAIELNRAMTYSDEFHAGERGRSGPSVRGHAKRCRRSVDSPSWCRAFAASGAGPRGTSRCAARAVAAAAALSGTLHCRALPILLIRSHATAT